MYSIKLNLGSMYLMNLLPRHADWIMFLIGQETAIVVSHKTNWILIECVAYII